MLTELTERLRGYRFDTDEQLRVVLVYDRERLEPLYIRDDVEEEVSKLPLDSLHNPLWQVHRSVWLASRVYDRFGQPEASIHHYRNILFFHFLINPDGGIVMAFDPETIHSLSEQYADYAVDVHDSSKLSE